ncbi:MAG: hypothetical protein RLO18_22340, partial [Gimesia chilikensis]
MDLDRLCLPRLDGELPGEGFETPFDHFECVFFCISCDLNGFLVFPRVDRDFLNDTLNGTAFQPLQRPQKSKSKRGWVFAGLALATFVFLAGIVFKGETPAGTV